LRDRGELRRNIDFLGSGEMSIPFRWIEQKEETNRLVIVLPGAGYTTQAPLLHFATGLFYSKGFDVLHMNYSFTREEMSALNDWDFARAVHQSINQAMNDKQYSHYYVVAKSIGTKALSYLLNDPMLKDANLVWLTPLLQNDHVFHSMLNSEHKGLCFFGDNDHSCFITERFEQLRENQNLILKVISGGNHSLELSDDPIESIDLLKDVISEMNDFLNEQVGGNSSGRNHR
jgi:hypothetical protein